jgi:hypothetical protein
MIRALEPIGARGEKPYEEVIFFLLPDALVLCMLIIVMLIGRQYDMGRLSSVGAGLVFAQTSSPRPHNFPCAKSQSAKAAG